MTRALDRLRRRLGGGAAARARDVFLLGTSYSGSTLLGNALNGHSAIFHLGEVSRLPWFGLGDPAEECTLCTVSPDPCPVWTPELLAASRTVGAGSVHRLVRERLGGVPILVDGSKRVDWLRRCVGEPGALVSPFAIVTVRHPFAFADSCRRRIGLSAPAAAEMWRDVMLDTVSSLVGLGVPFLVVRYEDFAREPAWVLGRVADSLGLAPESGPMSFWEHDAHSVGGNAGAYMWFESFRAAAEFENDEDRVVAESYADRPFGGWHDEKWTTSLDEPSRAEIAACPGLVDVAALVGYPL